jgi:hypothetical protein
MSYPDQLVPIPVRLHPDDLSQLAGHVARKSRCHYNITFRSLQLNAANPVKSLCAADPSREGILVQAFTNDVVLCETQGKAQDPANSLTANPGFPEGYLLAKANTKPTWLPSTDLIWVTAGTFPALVTICLINEVRQP